MDDPSPVKKHKHKKHKKHKKSKSSRHDPSHHSTNIAAMAPAPLKIKFKFGGVSLGESGQVANSAAPKEKDSHSKKRKSKDDDEEAWLDALEAGELDERGELRRDGPQQMTQRQRAKIDREQEEAELEATALANVRPPSPLSAEALARKQEANRRRKLIAEKQAHDEKQATVQKLLKKQSSSKVKKAAEQADKTSAESRDRIRMTGAWYRYINKKDSISLELNNGATYPIEASKAEENREPKQKQKCSAKDCTEDRRYAVASNNLPVCSLKCYREVAVRTS